MMTANGDEKKPADKRDGVRRDPDPEATFIAELWHLSSREQEMVAAAHG